ncbi:Ig-like domain-containing protein, partial [Staphylococcus aureus]|nr:Ig-like domain-containing protein [Staphylococcus aureus]
VTGYDAKGSTAGRDYVFMETFGKTYDEFMSSRGEQTTEAVEKEMKKTEKVKVTSVNIEDDQITVKVDENKQLTATTEPSGQRVTYKVTEGQGYASVSPTGLVKGLAEGNATVTATAGEQSDTVQVTVQSNLEM